MTKTKIISLYRCFPEEVQREKLCCKMEPGTFEFALVPQTESEEELHRAVSDANVILTPPIASGIWNAENQFNDQIADNLARVVNGETPYYLINDVWET